MLITRGCFLCVNEFRSACEEWAGRLCTIKLATAEDEEPFPILYRLLRLADTDRSKLISQFTKFIAKPLFNKLRKHVDPDSIWIV